MKRSTIIGALINAFEWYEYAVYGYLATVIGALFFPETDQTTQVLATYGVLAAGFAMRPLGAVLFGHIGDRYGRRTALLLSLWVMCIPTTLIGLLPTYATAGIWASVILVGIRLVQGLAVGGNYGGSFIFAIEHAPEGQKSLAGSWGQVGVLGGMLLGSFAGYFFSHVLSAEALASWGWRLPFLMGIVTTGVAWYFKKYVPETPEFKAMKEAGSAHRFPLRVVWEEHKQALLKGIACVMLDAIGIYTLFIYFISYMQTQLGYSLSDALMINTLSMLVMVPSILGFGKLADLITPRRVLMGVAAGFVLWSYPFFAMIQHGSWHSVLLGQMVCALLMAACYGALPAVIVNLFPQKVRYSACGLTFNLCMALFGGTTPFLLTWLVKTTQSNTAPAFCLVAVGVLNLWVLWSLPKKI